MSNEVLLMKNIKNKKQLQSLRSKREKLLEQRDKYYMQQINPEEAQEQAEPQKCKINKPIIVTIYEN